MQNEISSRDLKYFLSLYMFMYTAREIDRIEESYTQRGEAFFHVSGGGHEAGAALARYLKPEDWLHCHYRDKSLMLARAWMRPCFSIPFLIRMPPIQEAGR